MGLLNIEQSRDLKLEDVRYPIYSAATTPNIIRIQRASQSDAVCMTIAHCLLTTNIYVNS